MKKIRLIADTFIKGLPLAVDSGSGKNIHELEDSIASALVAANKAEYVSAETEDLEAGVENQKNKGGKKK